MIDIWEVEKLRAELAAEREWKRANIELAEQLVTVTAERDALRAELDAERQSKGTHHLWERIRILNLARKSAEAERDAMRALLKDVANTIEPIASLAAKFDSPHGYIDEAEWVSVAHLRRARAVYEQIKGGDDE